MKRTRISYVQWKNVEKLVKMCWNRRKSSAFCSPAKVRPVGGGKLWMPMILGRKFGLNLEVPLTVTHFFLCRTWQRWRSAGSSRRSSPTLMIFFFVWWRECVFVCLWATFETFAVFGVSGFCCAISWFGNENLSCWHNFLCFDRFVKLLCKLNGNVEENV